MKKLPNRRFNVNILLWLALGLALLGSLKHLAAIFAGVDGDHLMGWLQAIAIDAGLFALAYSMRIRKTAKRTTKPLWFGILLFSAISIYGNLAYGLLATEGQLPQWIATARPYILAASLPILVLFLSELLSDDHQHAAALAQRAEKIKAKSQPKTDNLPPGGEHILAVNERRKAQKSERLEQLPALMDQYPKATNKQLGNMLGVTDETIRKDRLELAEAINLNGSH